MGYWFCSQHEHLLLATRGAPPAPAMGTQASSLISAPVREHSRKPTKPMRSSNALSDAAQDRAFREAGAVWVGLLGPEGSADGGAVMTGRNFSRIHRLVIMLGPDHKETGPPAMSRAGQRAVR